MREKQPLALLKAMVSSAKPARDFKAAILKRAAETGWCEFLLTRGLTGSLPLPMRCSTSL